MSQTVPIRHDEGKVLKNNHLGRLVYSWQSSGGYNGFRPSETTLRAVSDMATRLMA